MKYIATAIISLGLAPVLVQAADDVMPATAPVHQHSGDMQMTQGMNHSGMTHDMSGGDQPSQAQGMSDMDHGAMQMDMQMQMQSGTAPANARDPHAYSNGYSLDAGPYALPGPRKLRMADEHNFGALLVDRLERVNTRNGDSTTYDAQAWFGRDYNRLVLKAEGDIANGNLEDAKTQLLWGHAIAAFWDSQLGVRYDSGEGPNRSWLALGVQGLAPYWFEVDATAFLGESGRTALDLEAEYDLLLTQRLILQPRAEVSFYGKRDPERELGSGLADLAAGVRLRYEIRREIAPYVGVEWGRKFGQTADFVRAAGNDASETRWLAGVRFWF